MTQAHAATLRRDGGVIRGPSITRAAAITRRRAGLDVVVRGPAKVANRIEAETIETEANGPCERHTYHQSAGALGLPHFQPVRRPPAGHTFYEVDKRKAASEP